MKPVAEVSSSRVHAGEEFTILIKVVGSNGCLAKPVLEVDFSPELRMIASAHAYSNCAGVQPGVPPIRCTLEFREFGPSIRLTLGVPRKPGNFFVTARLVRGSRDGNPGNDTLTVPITSFARRSHPVRLDWSFPHSSILWIGAHPDDEILIAPLLGDNCKERNARCHLLVATRGEAGLCLLPGGCSPDLGTVRVEEMKRSAALFNAALTQWKLPDGSSVDPDVVIDRWFAAVGGEDQLVGEIAWLIETLNVEAVIAFDPDHGSTGHPDHRAIGELTRRAMKRVRTATTLYVLESRVDFVSSLGFELSIQPAVTDRILLAYDANWYLPHLGDSAWRYATLTAMTHASQYGNDWLRAIANVHPWNRRVYLWKVPAK